MGGSISSYFQASNGTTQNTTTPDPSSRYLELMRLNQLLTTTGGSIDANGVYNPGNGPFLGDALSGYLSYQHPSDQTQQLGQTAGNYAQNAPGFDANQWYQNSLGAINPSQAMNYMGNLAYGGMQASQDQWSQNANNLYNLQQQNQGNQQGLYGTSAQNMYDLTNQYGQGMQGVIGAAHGGVAGAYGAGAGAVSGAYGAGQGAVNAGVSGGQGIQNALYGQGTRNTQGLVNAGQSSLSGLSGTNAEQLTQLGAGLGTRMQGITDQNQQYIMNSLAPQLVGAGNSYYNQILSPQIASNSALMGTARSGGAQQAQALGAASISLPIAQQIAGMTQQNLAQGYQGQLGVGQMTQGQLGANMAQNYAGQQGLIGQNIATQGQFGLANMANQAQLSASGISASGQLGAANIGAQGQLGSANINANAQLGTAGIGAMSSLANTALGVQGNLAGQNMTIQGQYGLAGMQAQQAFGVANMNNQTQYGLAGLNNIGQLANNYQQNIYGLSQALPQNYMNAQQNQMSLYEQGIQASDYSRLASQYNAEQYMQGYLASINATPFNPGGTQHQNTWGNQYGVQTSASGGAGGAVGLGSDRRLKQDIAELDSKVFLDTLTGYTYAYKASPEETHAGVMAQDLEQSALGAEYVHEDAQGYKYVDYARAMPLMLACLAAMNKRVNVLETALAEAMDHATP